MEIVISLEIKIIVCYLRFTFFFVNFPWQTASMENTKYGNHKLLQNRCFFSLRTASTEN